MVSVCLPSDTLSQYLPSYLGFPYLGRGVSSRLLQQSTATAPYLGRGVSSDDHPSWPWTWSSSSQPSWENAKYNCYYSSTKWNLDSVFVCVYVGVCVCVPTFLLNHIWFFGTPWTIALQAPLSMEFSRQEYWSGVHSLLQGIFLTQRLSLHLLFSALAVSLPLATSVLVSLLKCFPQMSSELLGYQKQ